MDISVVCWNPSPRHMVTANDLSPMACPRTLPARTPRTSRSRARPSSTPRRTAGTRTRSVRARIRPRTRTTSHSLRRTPPSACARGTAARPRRLFRNNKAVCTTKLVLTCQPDTTIGANQVLGCPTLSHHAHADAMSSDNCVDFFCPHALSGMTLATSRKLFDVWPTTCNKRFDITKHSSSLQLFQHTVPPRQKQVKNSFESLERSTTGITLERTEGTVKPAGQLHGPSKQLYDLMRRFVDGSVLDAAVRSARDRGPCPGVVS